MIMADDLSSVPEDYVTDPNGSCLAVPIDNKGVFTATHGKKEGATDKPSSGLLLGEDGHLKSVMEDDWWEGFIMLGGGVI